MFYQKHIPHIPNTPSHADFLDTRKVARLVPKLLLYPLFVCRSETVSPGALSSMLPENHTEAAQRQIRDGDFQAWVEAQCMRFYFQDHDGRHKASFVFEAH